MTLKHYILALVLSFVGLSNAQLERKVYVGITYDKAFFTVPSRYSWQESLDMCLLNGWTAASVNTHLENEIVSNFLNSSSYFSDIPTEDRAFWIPATDFEDEGNFTWIQTRQIPEFSNWAENGTLYNRSRNCAIIRSNGEWSDEVCSGSYDGELHIPLCEITLINYRNVRVDDTDLTPSPIPKLTPTAEFNETWETYGPVNGKLYYADRSFREDRWAVSRTTCHENGLRLATTETIEEIDFVANMSMSFYMQNQTNYLINLGGSSILTHECGISTTRFYWHHSGVTFDTSSPHFRYKCLMMVPGYMTNMDCIAYWGVTVCEGKAEPQ
ncbi:hypothetical protein HA402_003586 [Bradysia odoriphaga]|nr:hypothetical protein HA402_003586 [Bradysia odoriphaga]